MGVERRKLAGERLFEDRRETLPQRAVVTVARHIGEAGHKALQRIATNKQRDPLPLLQIENADDRVVQLIFIGLEKLVAWIGIEDVRQSLAVVAHRRQAGALDDVANLEPQQRDRTRVPAIGDRGEEAKKQRYPDDFSAWAEAAHSDRIHMRGAVHRRPAVRFGNDEKLAATHEI